MAVVVVEWEVVIWEMVEEFELEELISWLWELIW